MKTLREFIEQYMTESPEDVQVLQIGDTVYDDLQPAESFESTPGDPLTAFPDTVIVWTENTVYFVDDYDGEESLRSVPRHPGESP